MQSCLPVVFMLRLTFSIDLLGYAGNNTVKKEGYCLRRFLGTLRLFKERRNVNRNRSGYNGWVCFFKVISIAKFTNNVYIWSFFSSATFFQLSSNFHLLNSFQSAAGQKLQNTKHYAARRDSYDKVSFFICNFEVDVRFH